MTAGPAQRRAAGFVPPPYPYDRLGEIVALADKHDGGAIELSIGTPCDPAPDEVVAALSAGVAYRGYPPSVGTAAFRQAAAQWIERRLGATVDPDTELAATVGSKEFVASVPQYLKLRDPSRDTVLYPEISYPTYAMGATLGGARAVPFARLDDVDPADAERALCVWVNSPANPTGELSDLPAAAAWGRAHAVPVFSDECYAEFTYAGTGDDDPARRHRGRHRRALVVQARQLRRRPDRLLRRGSRARALPERGPQARRVDAAGTGPGRRRRSPLADDAHVEVQRRALPAPDAPADRCPRRLWARRRAARGRVLPLGGRARTATPGRPRALLAERAGIVSSPGEFYGDASAGFLRLAVVQPDDRIELAAHRVGL